jgi:hypothetical protein
VDVLEADYSFYSRRYEKRTTAPKGFQCDGATGVPDTKEKCYRIHDWDFFAAIWDDGTPMSFEEANNNYTDLLAEKGHWILARTRRTLYWLGRGAWEEHRRAEMRWQNMKVLAQFRVDRGLN